MLTKYSFFVQPEVIGSKLRNRDKSSNHPESVNRSETFLDWFFSIKSKLAKHSKYNPKAFIPWLKYILWLLPCIFKPVRWGGGHHSSRGNRTPTSVIFIEDVVDCPDQLTGVVFHDKCQKTQQGNLLFMMVREMKRNTDPLERDGKASIQHQITKDNNL